ncbi:jg19048 [Pararge aegeria aegeria]|uniref:Jg19048 protein n=1 Tax=Pararge aegeria aegeria TaxID=348720 RepID=A0A8S4QVX5_9NEOP|nr:jg19048 [Pararge aegeria aegeria]
MSLTRNIIYSSGISQNQEQDEHLLQLLGNTGLSEPVPSLMSLTMKIINGGPNQSGKHEQHDQNTPEKPDPGKRNKEKPIKISCIIPTATEIQEKNTEELENKEINTKEPINKLQEVQQNRTDIKTYPRKRNGDNIKKNSRNMPTTTEIQKNITEEKENQEINSGEPIFEQQLNRSENRREKKTYPGKKTTLKTENPNNTQAENKIQRIKCTDEKSKTEELTKNNKNSKKIQNSKFIYFK